MKSVRVGITTQTPLLRFVSTSAGVSLSPSRGQFLMSRLREGVDYELTPGGVTRMVLPSVREWSKSGWLKQAHWFSLQPTGPGQISLEDLPLELHHVTLPAHDLAAYGRTKEKLWANIHGLPAQSFDVDDFRFYSRYNWFTSDALLAAAPDLDVAYVHDFQLMQVGALIGLAAPSVFRWHVPFEPERIPPYTRNFLVRAMEDFDAVIVSTRRDLEGLHNAGYHGTARQVYPHIDPADWPDVRPSQVQELEVKWELDPDDLLVLCVARMDPIKRQDVAIRAAARLRRRFPRIRLVFVGNGSFSGSKKGGLSISRPQQWKTHLENLVQELRIEDRVTFANWIPNGILAAAYERADAVALPSDLEGFGLTVLEGWRYARPAIVGSGAGASEVIQDGVNGYTFPSGDDQRMADRLQRLFRNREKQETLGKMGRRSLRSYEVRRAAPRETEILQEAIARFGGS